MSLTKKQYLKIVYHLLPCHGKNEQRFYHDFKSSVDDFFEFHNTSDSEELINEFGAPPEVVSEFLKAQSSDYLLRQVNKRKLRKIGLSIFVTILIVGLSIFSTYCYKAYKDSKNSLIAQEKTFITDLP